MDYENMEMKEVEELTAEHLETIDTAVSDALNKVLKVYFSSEFPDPQGYELEFVKRLKKRCREHFRTKDWASVTNFLAESTDSQ